MERDQTRDEETHNGEQRPSESYNRSGGENSRQQGQRDTKINHLFWGKQGSHSHFDAW